MNETSDFCAIQDNGTVSRDSMPNSFKSKRSPGALQSPWPVAKRAKPFSTGGRTRWKCTPPCTAHGTAYWACPRMPRHLRRTRGWYWPAFVPPVSSTASIWHLLELALEVLSPRDDVQAMHWAAFGHLLFQHNDPHAMRASDASRWTTVTYPESLPWDGAIIRVSETDLCTADVSVVHGHARHVLDMLHLVGRRVCRW